MVRYLIVLAWVFWMSPACATDISGARLWVEIETGGRAPYPQEMVLLRVRGLFTVPIALEKLEQPDLPGFRWLSLGGDIWSATTQDGRPARALQRTLALFPQNSGELPIPAFTHRLTIVEPSGTRRAIEIASKASRLTVAPMPDTDGAWWLPARTLKVTESWSVPPDALMIGQSTRRTITIEAFGVTDDQLPPMPAMKVAKLIAFPATPERSTIISVSLDDATAEQRRQALRRPGRLPIVSGPDGPLARVSYSWDIRPTTDEPVTLPAIDIPWFDTAIGTAQSARLPERVVAVDMGGPAIDALEAALGIAGEPQSGRSTIADLSAALLAALAAFAVTWRLLTVWRSKDKRREPMTRNAAVHLVTKGA